MSSKFYFGSNSSASSVNSQEDDDPSTLPYPKALPRSDFLTPEFSPQDYLSSLGHRHQTLEDLRADLRARSQLLNGELLDLVNSHYQDFLGLGTSLKGGDEKVEELKVGLLGFQREIESVTKVVLQREKKVEGLLREREAVGKQIALARMMLDMEKRISRMEDKFLLRPATKGLAEDRATVEDVVSSDSEEEDAEEEDDDDVDDDAAVSIPLGRLRLRVDDMMHVKFLMDEIGLERPFVVAQQDRMAKIRNALLVDLARVLKQARLAGSSTTGRLMKILAMYRDIDEGKEAAATLKSMKS